MQQIERKKLKDKIDWMTVPPIKKLRKLVRVISSMPSYKIRKLLWYSIENGMTTFLIAPSGRMLFKEDKKTEGFYCLLNGKVTSYMGDNSK